MSSQSRRLTQIPADEVGDTDPDDYANQLIEEQDPRIDSKWGPAGCIHVGDDTYLFFGWAST